MVKTLLKKLNATKSQQLEYMHTGGGLTTTMDDVTFELLRFSIDQYYNSGDVKQFDVTIDQSKDNKNNVVQFTQWLCWKTTVVITSLIYTQPDAHYLSTEKSHHNLLTLSCQKCMT